MSVPLGKIVSSMTDADWLQIHVISQVNLFETKFNTRIDSQEIEDICNIVGNLKLPEGVDTFYTMMLLIEGKETQLHLDSMLVACELRGLTLGLDMLVYMYSQISEGRGYDSEVAFIFKNCIQYTIPF